MSGHAHGELPAGILPVDAPRALASRLDVGLGRAVAENGQRSVLGPAEVDAVLSASPSLSRKLAEARQSLDLAEEACQQMEQRTAVNLALRAETLLNSVGAKHHARDLAVRAHLIRGLALRLKPAHPTAALEAFRQALELAADLKPDPDRFPPRAAQLFENARPVPRRRSAPSTDAAASLARAAGVAHLLWISGTPSASGLELEVQVFDRRGQLLQQVQARSTLKGALTEAARLTSFALARVRLGDVAIAGDSPTTDETAPAPAWYKRWYVWTIAGVVLAGAGVGIAVAATRQDSSSASGFDFRFHFK